MKLAITGEMGSGKTSIAKYLVEKYNFKKFSFADDVKLYATEIFDININVKDRKLLQQFATKMKEIDENIWIKRLDNKIKDIYDNIIIDDLRILICILNAKNMILRCIQIFLIMIFII